MRYTRLVFAIVVTTGCISEAPDSDGITGPEAMAAKGGQADLNSRTNWTFYSTLSDGVTTAVMVGDGRGLDGGPSPTPGESSYPGEICGVRGYLFKDGSGDAVFDPAFDPDFSPCGNRVMLGNLGAGVVPLTPFMNARQVWQMAESTQKVEDMLLSLLNAVTPCGTSNSNTHLAVTVANGSGVVIARLPTVDGAGVWTVETTGNHLAACMKWSKGRWVDSGLDVYLPFSARFVEIPAPAGGW